MDLAGYYTITLYPYNLEINKSTVPSGAVNMFASQITNNPAISSPVPQPAQMTSGVSRSDFLPGNQSRKVTQVTQVLTAPVNASLS